ncbi:MAG: hypothetical protein GXP19_09200 [Gammaproteobacteria bacterium]|nr:hypothetical protein [Gammaproteobacteria bacterium]
MELPVDIKKLSAPEKDALIMEQHKMLHEQIISVLLIVAGFAHWTENEAGTVTLMARAVYFVGMFACTVLFNVPPKQFARETRSK